MARITPALSPSRLSNSENALDELGQLEEAAEAYRRALEAMPNLADAHYNLARVYKRLGRRREGQRHWRAHLRLDPDSRWARFARARLHQDISAA